MIKVAIVEDRIEYLAELSHILQAGGDVEVVGKFLSVADAKRGLPLINPRIVLVDLGLPDGNGVEIIKGLADRPNTECLVLTVYDDDAHLFAALEAGAVGYILKDQMGATELLHALDETLAGGAPMSFSIARRVLARFSENPRRKPNARCASEVLTAREREVLQELAKGHNARRVAEELNLAYHTVRCHQKNIYQKLHVSSVVAALAAVDNL